MKLEMEFHDSIISDVKVLAELDAIEIRFSHVVIVTTPESSAVPQNSRVSATIRITKPKYKRLPKKGLLSDGELYGIPGKPLNGRIPVDFQCDRECELELSVESTDYSITGKSFLVVVDLATLPDELRH
ncbi:MAG: hypothetical protein H7249_16060 [Chitinophagaceae bacterium]|nr:hypothetical protein [Oligoflexus sp.]